MWRAGMPVSSMTRLTEATRAFHQSSGLCSAHPGLGWWVL